MCGKFYFLLITISVLYAKVVCDDDFYEYYNYGDEKIVNGFDADMKDFYYQISLRIAGNHFCGGTIISDRFVLTAGHCIKPHLSHVTKLTIQAGTTNVGSESGQIISVTKAYLHPQFNDTSLDYDMALVELANELDFTETARPIRVANRKKFPLDALAVVSGWGYTSEGGTAAKTLQAVNVPLIPPLTCLEFYKKTLTSRMICAGYVAGEKDACQGDSGGPLVFEKEIIGIVSWGRGCARPNRPGVYTNIYAMRSFLNKYAGIV